MTVNVKLKDETWKALNQRKEPGETFDDVVTKLVEQDNQEIGKYSVTQRIRQESKDEDGFDDGTIETFGF
jgi:predicted CopG family antitoxin